jgi:hypothetical protein
MPIIAPLKHVVRTMKLERAIDWISTLMLVLTAGTVLLGFSRLATLDSDFLLPVVSVILGAGYIGRTLVDFYRSGRRTLERTFLESALQRALKEAEKVRDSIAADEKASGGALEEANVAVAALQELKVQALSAKTRENTERAGKRQDG